MKSVLMDLRFGLRLLKNNPGFTVIAVLTLALGIGANTAIFSLFDALVYRALPIPAPEELYSLTDLTSSGIAFGSERGVRSLLFWNEFLHFRDQDEVLQSLFASSSSTAAREVRLDPDGYRTPIRTQVSLVSGHFFDVLSVPPLLGSVFGGEADDPGEVLPVAVVSDAFWERQYGRAQDVLGRRIKVFESEYQIIGVMLPSFFGETVGRRPDFWVPILTQRLIFPGQNLLESRGSVLDQPLWLNVMGWLRTAIEPERAEVGLNLLLDRYVESRFDPGLESDIREELPHQTIQLTPAATGASPLRQRYQQPLQAMMWMVVLVLLIACANVANLLLARGRMRVREVGVRLALGSSRAGLICQFLTESLMLAVIGGAVGLLVALWVQSLLMSLAAEGTLTAVQLRLDGRILGFCLLMSALSGVLFGLIPAMRTVSRDLTLAFKGTPGLSPGGKPSRHVGRTLVISQIALSVLLLIVTGLFIRTLQNAAAVDVGFDQDRVLIGWIPLAQEGYQGQAALNLVDQLLVRVAQIPGVLSATVSHNGLFSNSESGDPIAVEGFEPAPGERLSYRYDHVGPGYFSTVGMEIVRGRELSRANGRSGPRAGLINETFAERYFGGRDPLGKRVLNTHPDNPGEVEIIGIVRDAKYNSLREEPPPRFYVPYFNPMMESSPVALLARVERTSAGLVTAIPKELAGLDRGFERTPFTPLADLVDRTLRRERLLVRVTSLFGALALVLAAIGIYGILGYEVTRRAPEIGVRMALGASHLNVVWMVFRETMLLVGCGLAIGIPAVLAVARLANVISSQLFQVEPTDPGVLLGAALVMAMFAAVAAYLPARRAALVDPIRVLRCD